MIAFCFYVTERDKEIKGVVQRR